MSDTIAAVATGSIKAAIGIIRLSGDTAVDIASKVFKPVNGKDFKNCPSHKLILGSLLNESGELLDSCLAVLSHAPNSYTGEDTVEIHTHGSPVVLSAGLKALFSYGARQALAGEFTKRAFLNGRLDLTQAEAVIDLIDAETETVVKNAAAQLGGSVSRKTDPVYERLVGVSAHFHAIVDYPDEELEPFELNEVMEAVSFSEETLKSLLDTFDRGRVMKDGVRCAIIGRPNAGKSSLLNSLLGYERAIVTAAAGTTRDTIEEKLVLGGVLLRLIDTAGLRESTDEAEILGVGRARAAAENAELVFAVFDGSQPLTEEDFAVIKTSRLAPKAIALINKLDLQQALDAEELRKYYTDMVFVSALTGAGISRLEEIIRDSFNNTVCSSIPAGEILTNTRQYDAILRAYSSILRAKSALIEGFTPDAVLTDTEEALSALGELSGKTVREDITRTIFSRFCVGK